MREHCLELKIPMMIKMAMMIAIAKTKLTRVLLYSNELKEMDVARSNDTVFFFEA